MKMYETKVTVFISFCVYKSFANPEDTKHLPNAKVTLTDEEVERVRR